MRLLQPIDALRGALIDPARRERTVLAALAVYLVLWTIYGTIAKSSQGLHPDMTELIAWSRDLAWGYKHPPLAAASCGCGSACFRSPSGPITCWRC